MNNRVNRVLLIFAFLYVISLLLWFSIQPMPELQDLAEWVFQSAVMERLLNPASLLHAQFAWVHMAVPNMLAQLLLMGASAVVGALQHYGFAGEPQDVSDRLIRRHCLCCFCALQRLTLVFGMGISITRFHF
jgi:hypothetical protein